MITIQLAALLAGAMLTGVAIFQIALALGAPLGAYAWGGKHPGVLPPRLQLGSAVSVPILLGMAIVVLIRGGVIYSELGAGMTWAVWLIFLFMVLNTFANWRSDSLKERRVMASLTLVIALLLAYIQLSAP